MTKTVVLDCAPLGLLTAPPQRMDAQQCTRWFADLLVAGNRVVIPEITDYELRRELLRAGKKKSVARLDALAQNRHHQYRSSVSIRSRRTLADHLTLSRWPVGSDAVASAMGSGVECGHSIKRFRKPRSRFMAHSRFHGFIAAVVAMAVVVALWIQPNGRGDSGQNAAEREGEVEDLGTVTVPLGGGITMEFVLIPAGRFLMGSPKEEKERCEDEGPQHEVTISRAFYLGKYEVTQEQYQRIMGKNPSYFSAEGDGKQKVVGLDTRRFPVECVSWNEAKAYCDKLSARDGKRRRFRLPTEAEWEYACRAGTKTPFHFGDALNGDRANCDGTNPYGTDKKGTYLARTCRVGSYRPNALGLHDMHGNVWEWCADWYGGNYYHKSDKKDPQGSQRGNARVLRGGSWLNGARNCRAATRYGFAPGNRYSDFGFRVAFRLD